METRIKEYGKMRRNILIVVLLATLVFIGSASFAPTLSNTSKNNNSLFARSFSGFWTFDNSPIFASSAGDSGINGTVTDASTLAPIVNATVKAANITTMTDSEGHYEITIAPGNYTVMATKLGYTNQSKTASVIVNQTKTVNFALSKVVQEMGWIAGIVTDANTSMPLTGANVTADGFTATTNSNGTYKIQVLAMKTYNVTAEKTGYKEKTVSNVTVAANQTKTVNFALTRNPTPPPPTTIPAKIRIEPRSLNLKSNGKWITVEIELPKNFSIRDINVSSIRLNGTIPVAENAPMNFADTDETGKLIVKFSREAVQDLIMRNGQTTKFAKVTLTITGNLNGTMFSGNDTIKTILPMPNSNHGKHGKN